MCRDTLLALHTVVLPRLQSWKNLFSRNNLPMLLMGTSLAALQQLTGINASE